MKIIKPSHAIETPLDGNYILKHIERCGRTCYKSEHKIVPGSAEAFVAHIIKRGHESVLEHFSITVRIVCDRGVSHELVRHRIASFSQESTRYCNYGKDDFDREITVIKPCVFVVDTPAYTSWVQAMSYAETSYFSLLAWGCSPQEARTVLPNSLKTEVVITANLREWRTIFNQRTAVDAHPQMREIMRPLLRDLRAKLPIVFDDVGVA